MQKECSHLLKTITEIGIALSAEKNHTQLLEFILVKAIEITHADGGTLYTCIDNTSLHFEIMINKSMNIHIGGTSTDPSTIPDLQLYNDSKEPMLHMLAPRAAITRRTINIENIYTNTQFDFSGAKLFDQKMNYHSQSFLTVPMTNHLNEVIGVLQLINATDKNTKKIIPFSHLDQQLIESLASQAAVTITNRDLINSQKELFNSLIQLIAQAVDDKSPYTGKHCRRVPVITTMLARAVCDIDRGPLKTFALNDDEFYELEVAAWLHDCGKIITPAAVVDKATKLERIMDGIELIDSRFELLKRDHIINALEKELNRSVTDLIDNDKDLASNLQQLDREREQIRHANIGGELMLSDDLAAIDSIAAYQWGFLNESKKDFLSAKEKSLLKISRGTLSTEERNIINNHVCVSIKMLESLPYPKNLKNVPLLAGCHHEKMDGTGYPRGLTKEQIPIPARIIAIADIFEALTANDRPYKKAMPLLKALNIMGQMKLDGHIDPDLFDVFIDAQIYQTYALNYLDQTSTVAINPKEITGYHPI